MAEFGNKQEKIGDIETGNSSYLYSKDDIENTKITSTSMKKGHPKLKHNTSQVQARNTDKFNFECLMRKRRRHYIKGEH